MPQKQPHSTPINTSAVSYTHLMLDRAAAAGAVDEKTVTAAPGVMGQDDGIRLAEHLKMGDLAAAVGLQDEYYNAGRDLASVYEMCIRDRKYSQVPCITTRKRVAQHCYPPGNPLLPLWAIHLVLRHSFARCYAWHLSLIHI